MSRALLLDTCAAIWSVDPDENFAPGEAAIEQTAAEGGTIYVSPIVAWEVGLLVSRGRLALRLDPKRWFVELLSDELKLAPLTPAILIDSSFLPKVHLRDPADRMMAATARALGCPLMTRDRALLDYAQAGWMQAVPC